MRKLSSKDKDQAAAKPAKPPSSPERREMFMRLGLLTIAVFIDLLGFSIIIPLVPYYVIGGLHLSGPSAVHDANVGRYASWLIAAYAGMQFIFAPIWGRLSDRVGRKPLLIASLLGDALFYTLFAFSRHSLLLLFASRILAGIFSSASLSVAQAYIADITPPEYRASALGHIGAAFGVAFILGPLIGGELGRFELGLPLYFASALAIGNAVYIALKLPESRSAATRAVGVAPSGIPNGTLLTRMLQVLSGPVGFLYFLTFLVTFAFSQLEGTFTPYIVQRFNFTQAHSVAVAGNVFGYVGLILVLIQGGAIRPLTKRFGETPLVLVGVLMMAIGFLLFPLAHTLVQLLAGPLLLIAAGSALNSPALRAIVSRLSSASNQGGALGLSASFDSLARFLGPAIAGELYIALGIKSPYWTAGLVMTAAFILALTQRGRMAKDLQASEIADDLHPQNAPEPAVV